MYVPLPGPEDRASILRALASKVNISKNVDLSALAKSPRAEGYSGADCATLLREAGLAVLRENTMHKRKLEVRKGAISPLQISNEHFEYAFDHVMPSVSKKDQKAYDRIRSRIWLEQDLVALFLLKLKKMKKSQAIPFLMLH